MRELAPFEEGREVGEMGSISFGLNSKGEEVSIGIAGF
jgi:hypothetical protein